ncbi:hypothetical protein [Streptomyces albidoflavus]|uniref:SCO2584 family spore wall biosynthesis protein n=1 Tax=Streptomyces albidoflavus TaxID=1886 RepID=UPI00344E8DEC
MPEDVGGSPFPDGRQPDDDHDRGGADDAFASVVFDEDFIRAAEFHEASAVERLVAAAHARAEAEARRARTRTRDAYHEAAQPFGPDPAVNEDYDPSEADDAALHPTRVSWHRPIAWLLALLMGVGMIALAFSAVYRGSAASGDRSTPPPATTGADPTADAGFTRPAASAAPLDP